LQGERKKKEGNGMFVSCGRRERENGGKGKKTHILFTRGRIFQPGKVHRQRGGKKKKKGNPRHSSGKRKGTGEGGHTSIAEEKGEGGEKKRPSL